MRTKLTAWLNTETCEPMYGVKVFVRGVWANLAIDGKAALYPTEAEAQEQRAIMRKRRAPPTPQTEEPE